MRLGLELRRLARHSAIYGIGGLVSRILAVLLLPLYTRYLSRADYGSVETLAAANAVLVIVLRGGISSAFFRFYFDSPEPARRTVVVRTSFWFTMAMATTGLVLALVFAGQVADGFNMKGHADLVRAAGVALWAQMNYEQLTSLFRVEERSVGFALASLANVLITIGATVGLVVGLHKGALGVIVGNFVGTLTVYLVLLGYRRYQLGLQFDTRLYREMQHFGWPLVPAALALWAINFIDRLLISEFKGQAEVGVYSVAVRVSSAIVFLMVAFRTAWPAFAYSIEDERDARRTYAFVLTYLLAFTSWAALALGALAPWVVDAIAAPKFHRAHEAVALLSFAAAVYAGYTVLAIGSGRARKTQLNWVVTGVGAAVNIGLNFWLIPAYGMVGAAVATVAAYVALFAGMTIYAQSVYPVPYQWRRIATVAAASVGLTLAARVPGLGIGPSLALVAIYPLALVPLGFYLPAERQRLRRLLHMPANARA